MALVVALLALVVLPAIAAAHPLGNFTINHYAGLFVEPERVLLDIVIDQAEIPAFTARQAIDTDTDGDISDAELEAGRLAACGALADDLTLSLDGVELTPVLLSAGLAFPPGVGGLQTMRTVCEFVADFPAPITAASTARLAFADGTFPARLGWREIVVDGSGVAVTGVAGGGEVRADSVTDRLTSYPADLVPRPLNDGALQVDVAVDAAAAILPRPSFAEASAVPGAPVVPAPASAGSTPSTGPASAAPSASAGPSASASAGPAVPGGVGGGEVPSIFREANLTPVVLLLSVLTAIALGAGHALTPGHGKTLMAAYLVGTRGRPLHAVGLGLSVSISHTAGILVLAALVLGATDLLPADVVVRAAPVVASLSILAIGAWMLAGEWRRRRSVSAAARAMAAGSVAAESVAHRHEHPHPPEHVHADEHGRADGHGHPHDHPHADEHDHPHAGEHAHDHPHADDAAGEHRHGGIRHSHLPPAGSTITWRSLFILGLAGGLIPSTSALLILLGSIASGRAAFGFILVVAFGLGMAAVMTGIGLVLVFARERLDRLPSTGGLTRARDAVPLVAALLVFGFGIYLTFQALAGTPTL